MKYDLIDLSRVSSMAKSSESAWNELRDAMETIASDRPRQFYNVMFYNDLFDPSSRNEIDNVVASNIIQKPLDPTASEYINGLIDLDLLAVPILGIELQLIRKRGSELIFHVDDLAAISEMVDGVATEEEAFSGQYSKTQSKKGLSVSSAGWQGRRSGSFGKTPLLYDSTSDVIGFLNAHPHICKEITTMIAFRAVSYEFWESIRKWKPMNVPTNLAHSIIADVSEVQRNLNLP